MYDDRPRSAPPQPMFAAPPPVFSDPRPMSAGQALYMPTPYDNLYAFMLSQQQQQTHMYVYIMIIVAYYLITNITLLYL